MNADYQVQECTILGEYYDGIHEKGSAIFSKNWKKYTLVTYFYLLTLLIMREQINKFTNFQFYAVCLESIYSGLLSIAIVNYFFYSVKESHFVKKLWSPFISPKFCMKACILYCIYTSLIMLGCLLLFVPSIYFSAIFSQSIYLLIQNPNISIFETLKESKKMISNKQFIVKVQIGYIGCFSNPSIVTFASIIFRPLIGEIVIMVFLSYFAAQVWINLVVIHFESKESYQEQNEDAQNMSQQMSINQNDK